MDAEPATAFGATLIGETEHAATEALTAAGFSSRIAARDGERFALTMDWVPSRINLTINDGLVTNTSIG